MSWKSIMTERAGRVHFYTWSRWCLQWQKNNNNTIIYYRGTLSEFKHSITIILLEATLISDIPLCNEVQMQLDLHVQPAYQ